MQRRQVNILVQSKLIKLLKSVLTSDKCIERQIAMYRWQQNWPWPLTFKSPISICTFLTVLLSLLKVPMREFVQALSQFICGDRFIHSHDLYVCSGSVTVWRNRMLDTIGALRVNIWLKHGSFNVYLSRQTYIHKRYLILNPKSSIFVDFCELTHYKTSKIK